MSNGEWRIANSERRDDTSIHCWAFDIRCTSTLVAMFPLIIVAVVLIQSASAAQEPDPRTDHAWRTSDRLIELTNQGVALMERYAYAPAVKAFESALAISPQSRPVRINLALAIFNRAAKGDLELAAELLDSVLKDNPTEVRALYFRGIIHQYKGEDESAVPCFEGVLKQVPHDASTWYLLGRSKSHLDQPCRAEFERAVKENPSFLSAYYDLMRLARQEGDADKAKLYRDKFLSLRKSLLSDKFVMPSYNQMGPLARVQPLLDRTKRSISSGELTSGSTQVLFEGSARRPLRGPHAIDGPASVATLLAPHGIQTALADVNGDGHLDLVTTAVAAQGRRSVLLLLGQADGTFVAPEGPSPFASVGGAVSCAFGDYDNDQKVDLFISCVGPNYLFRGRGDGTFEDVTASTGTGGLAAVSISAVFLDADHDADLDIYVCNAGASRDGSPISNQLLNNNSDGTFTDITKDAGVGCASLRSIMLAPADLDGDRDTDLLVFSDGTPARVFFNDRLGVYHEGAITTDPIRADRGGVLQDFNGDGRPDLLVLPAQLASARLYLNDGSGAFLPSEQFDQCVKALATWGGADNTPSATRVTDCDLDGDLDIAFFGKQGHILLNDGWGRFVLRDRVWTGLADAGVIATDLVDFTSDGLPDLLRISNSGNGRIELTEMKLTPPANWLAVIPTGIRGIDKRTRSPASGFGTRIELRCGIHSQVMDYTGLSGGLSQSQIPMIFGLDGADNADYVAFRWTDGVSQFEHELAAGTVHRISELERKVSSCPVLFAFNGERFEFIGDFAGVGGLGYFVAPGQYASPQVVEHVKIEADQLSVRDGAYEIRITEPMEEVAYVDRIELLAVDHPEASQVFPDERLAVTGPPPTHKLLWLSDPIFPVRATDPNGRECSDKLKKVDRIHAYEPELDPRFVGFCKKHTLVLDFGDQLDRLNAGEEVYLFLNSSIEYPYSQTTYAASQAGVRWEPLKIERLETGGRWETVVQDAGAPGGIGRTMTVDLTGELPPGTSKLRIVTNLEIYYDQLFIAQDRGAHNLTVTSVPMLDAKLRRLGFPLEYSPDGQLPLIYTYDIIEPTSSFKLPKGAYTRYGPVDELLRTFDDKFAILGSGDEIAIRFDAGKLPPLGEGTIRSFILVSHAYCKDMDLYTAKPDTVEPLPFATMSAYPYPAKAYPAGDQLDRYQRRFNTRLIGSGGLSLPRSPLGKRSERRRVIVP